MTNKTSDQAEAIMGEAVTPKMIGNFPADQYAIDYLDPDTGLLTLKRISMQDRHLNAAGQEIPDPRPAAPSLGKKPEVNIRDYIATMVRSERLQQELDAAGHETFEEANDFEVGDDYFPDSQYENDLEPSVAELIREGNASLSAKARLKEKSEADALARKRASTGQTENEDSSPHKPEKSSRAARRAAPQPPEGDANDDHNPD